MGKGDTIGAMELSMKGIGWMIKPTEKESSHLMDRFIKESFRIIK